MKLKRPVVKLLRALYGHPRAGDLWHAKLDAILTKIGFQKHEAWPSVYVLKGSLAKGEMCIIVVYVDDLLISGAKIRYDVIRQLKKQVVMDEPTPISKYLGCMHLTTEYDAQSAIITEIVFDMRIYVKSAIGDYVKRTGWTLKPAASPYAPDLPNVALDRFLGEDGEHADLAASFVMKLMYAARMAVPQALTPVCRLASELSRWSKDGDRKLYRLYCYLNAYPDLVLVGSFSTADRDKVNMAWPDADLNSDVNTSKSTSGAFIEIAANGRSMPLAWWSRKQQCTATHACEAEAVSLAEALKEVIPIQDLFEMALNVPINAILKEDNAAALISANKGYSPTMRGLKRTQRVSIGYIHDTISAKPEPGHGTIVVERARAVTHRGDMFTKALDLGKCASALQKIGVIPFTDRPSRTKTPATPRADFGNMDVGQTEKNKTEKNTANKIETEKAAIAVIYSNNRYKDYRLNETASSSSKSRHVLRGHTNENYRHTEAASSSSTARCAWASWEDDHIPDKTWQ